MRSFLFCLLLLASVCSRAAEAEAVVAHPPFADTFSCTEHWAGQFKALGDALGTDCLIERLVETDGRTWLHAHSGDGSRNEDWFGWGQEVLSPCSCKVVKVNTNPVINSPGIVGRPPASFVMFERPDGISFVLAHVANLRVQLGSIVVAGQVIGVVGNNGYARSPHVHIGAWRGTTPLQIRFDQAAMGQLRAK